MMLLHYFVPSVSPRALEENATGWFDKIL